MTIRVALLAAECEPWAKTGGLADVVDALARALGRLPEAGTELATPVDVFLPRYRTVAIPPEAEREPAITVADPRGGAPLEAGIIDVAANGYRLRLVDVPTAFDREAYYDFPDDPWRFAVFNRAALAALKRDGAPIDVLHVHDWHTGPALIERARGEAARLRPGLALGREHRDADHHRAIVRASSCGGRVAPQQEVRRGVGSTGSRLFIDKLLVGRRNRHR